MGLFDGVENFTPAFTGRQLAIQEGAAMHKGLENLPSALEGIFEEGDEFTSAVNSDYDQWAGKKKKGGNSKSPFGASGLPGAAESGRTGPIGPPY